MTHDVKTQRSPSLSNSMELSLYIDGYLEYLKARNYVPQTIQFQHSALRAFMVWCADRGLSRVTEINRPALMRYQRYVAYAMSYRDKPLSIQTQCKYITAVRRMFRYLTMNNVLLYNPAADLELPKRPHRLPRHTLTAEEAELVLSQPNMTDPLGLRDRAILEILYSTGIRRQELINLRCGDIDNGRGIVAIRAGKGQRDRFIPVGTRALEWVRKYLADVRPLYETQDRDSLFLTDGGLRLDRNYLGRTVKRYIAQAKIEKQGSCHLFRHTMATLMLENGADIRFIQRMLGHSSLTTTEIYTHVSISHLQHVHNLTHPAQMSAEARHEREMMGSKDGTATNIAAMRKLTAQDVLDVLADEAQEETQDDDTDN